MSTTDTAPTSTSDLFVQRTSRAAEVARVAASFQLNSFYTITVWKDHVTAQTGNETEARALARLLCRFEQDPIEVDRLDELGHRHLALQVGDVRVLCYQRPAVSA